MIRSSLGVVLVLCFGVGAAQAGRPVARWDVVPDQRIDSTFKVGVVAFHLDGVKVEFRVNSTLVHTAGDPTYNDRTGVWEYWFSLDPSGYPDGPVAIDAKCVALNGTDPDYDLPSLNLYANDGGTLGSSVVRWADSVNGSDADPGTESLPYATLLKAAKNTPSGGAIYLKAGNYISDELRAGSTRPYWTTVTSAPGVDREDVVVGGGRPRTQRLKWTNVSFLKHHTGTWGGILAGEMGSHLIWLDGCYVENTADRWEGSLDYFGNQYVAYVTGGEGMKMRNGPAARIVRDYVMNQTTADPWSFGKLVVNCASYDIDAGSTGQHPDFHQSYAAAPGWVENVILYNVRGFDCNSQGLFGYRLRHSAFVNILIEALGPFSYSSYREGMDNVLYAHVALYNQSWLWKGVGDAVYTPNDVNVVNSLFNYMGYAEDAAASSELFIDHNNFFSATTQGSNATSGDPLFLNPSTDDYHISQSSPAAGNGLNLQCVRADIDGNPYNPTGRNRGCFAAKPGDADGDGDVDLGDFVILKRNFGATSGASRSQGDFDADGDVDLDDFIILKQNFGS